MHKIGKALKKVSYDWPQLKVGNCVIRRVLKPLLGFWKAWGGQGE